MDEKSVLNGGVEKLCKLINCNKNVDRELECYNKSAGANPPMPETALNTAYAEILLVGISYSKDAEKRHTCVIEKIQK